MYNKVSAVYFSGTGNTEKVTCAVGKKIGEILEIEYEECNITPLSAREKKLVFSEKDFIILGMPVIAGRVPNLIVPYLKKIEGNNAGGTPIITFGNRSYDDALIELRDIMENAGIHTIAAGAFVGEHSFSNILAADRPNKNDMMLAEKLAVEICNKLKECNFNINEISQVFVKGTAEPYSGYYRPQDRNGNHIDIRKVKPKTNSMCIACGLCVDLCPMGAIENDNPAEITGICMKCCACIKKCPTGAKYFEDKDFLYHKKELEMLYKRESKSEIFL